MVGHCQQVGHGIAAPLRRQQVDADDVAQPGHAVGIQQGRYSFAQLHCIELRHGAVEFAVGFGGVCEVLLQIERTVGGSVHRGMDVVVL